MARLPMPGGDNGNWGDILNDYLSQTLKSDGNIKDNAITANTIAPNAITSAKIATNAVGASQIADGSVTNILLADGTISETKLTSAVQTKLNSGGAIADGSVTRVKLSTNVQSSLDRADFGARSATLVIAAATSSAKVKAAADYVCDGNQTIGGDEAEINAAIAALPAGGGRIILAEGVFWRSAPIVCDKSYVTIVGQGRSTVVSSANNATGAANIIIGSHAAASQPQNCEIRDLCVQDGVGSSSSSSYSTSRHGIIMRCNTGHITNVTAYHQSLDSIRIEGTKIYGNASTLGASVVTVPAIATQETWAVASSATFTAGGFARLGGVSDLSGDPDYELVYVVSKPDSTHVTVRRGYGYSTIKTHSSGLAITPFTITRVFDNTVTDVYDIFPHRTGFYIDPWVTDSEFTRCKVDGGDSINSKLTVDGFINTGASNSFIVCHPYFCSNAGFIGNGAGLNTQCTQDILGGNYESNGMAGIRLDWCKNSRIDTTWYQNSGHNVQLMNCQNVAIAGKANSNTLLTNKHIYVYAGEQIHINGYSALDNASSDCIIHFAGTTKNSSIKNCGFTVGSDVSWSRMIQLTDSVYCEVSGNVIEGSIWESAGADYNLVHDNTLVPITPPPANNEQPAIHLVGVRSMQSNNTNRTSTPSAVGPAWWPSKYLSSNYYFCNSYFAPGSSTGLGFGSLRLTAWSVAEPLSLAAVFAEHTLAQSGTSFRIGVYADNGYGQPGLLVLDAGTIDTTVTAAVQQITVSVTLAPGLYWVGGVSQGAGTVPTMRIINANGVGMAFYSPLGTTLPATGQSIGIFSQAGVTGALPATFTGSATTGVVAPRIGFRVA